MSLVETLLPGVGCGDFLRCERREHIHFFVGERAAVRRTVRDLFGSILGSHDYACLAGAPAGAEIEVGLCDGQLSIEISDPRYHIYSGELRVCQTARGLVLVVDALHIHRSSMQGHGLGLAIFERQLCTARRLGIIRIETRAGRRPGENGYYSWPRYGFDGPLPDWLKRILPDEFSSVESIQDVMATSSGRSWWLMHGATIDVAFDVRTCSRSSQVFQKYLAEARQTCKLHSVSKCRQRCMTLETLR